MMQGNQAQYPPMAQQQMVQQPMGIQQPSNLTCMSPFPVQTTCPNCRQPTTTQIETKAGSGTWKMCCILFCFTGCCCIPFCMDSCKDKVHHCANCKAEIGKLEYKVC